MRIKASAGPWKRADIRDECYSLSLTALHREEGKFLSQLYQAIRHRPEQLQQWLNEKPIPE